MALALSRRSAGCGPVHGSAPIHAPHFHTTIDAIMQIIAGLVSLLKRATSEREVPAEEPASGSEQSGQHSELMHGAAADAKGRNKRMRLRDPPAAGAGALAGDFNLQVCELLRDRTGYMKQGEGTEFYVCCPSCEQFHTPAGQLALRQHHQFSTEPQFVLPDGGEATDDSSSHELSSSRYAPSRNEATTSSDAELENVLPQQGSGSTCGGTSQLACLNTELGACSGSSSSSLHAFMQRLLSPMVAAALVALEMGRLHPLSPGTLSSTVAGGHTGRGVHGPNEHVGAAQNLTKRV